MPPPDCRQTTSESAASGPECWLMLPARRGAQPRHPSKSGVKRQAASAVADGNDRSIGQPPSVIMS